MKVSAVSTGEEFLLKHALLVYQLGQQAQFHVTKHPVELFDGKPVIRPGVPFNEKDYKQLVDGLKPSDRPVVEWLDRKVLAKGAGRTLWWTPPQKRGMFFKSIGKKLVDGQGNLANPGLVFLADKKSLYIYAFKGKDAPTKQTVLYQCPMFNVWASGLVCNGNAGVPNAEDAGNPDAWEKFFFGSRFTHPNIEGADRLTKGVSPVKFWKSQIEKPDDEFPEQVLVELDLTVEQLLDPDFKGV